VQIVASAMVLLGAGLGVGMVSGCFGIGGGFLIVPALVLATGMPMPQAVGTSLVAVTAFGLTTTGSYAAAGLVAWGMAGIFIAGGVARAADAGVRSPDPGGRPLRAGAQPRAGRLRAIRW